VASGADARVFLLVTIFFVATGLDPVVHAEVQRIKTMP